MNFDFRLFQSLYGLTGQAKILDWLFIFFAKIFPYILFALFLAMLWRLSKNMRKRIYYFGFALISLSFSQLLLASIKMFFPRPRPPLELPIEPLITPPASPGLPSGHTTFFFTLGFILLFIFLKRVHGWLYDGTEETLPEKNRKGKKESWWFLFGALVIGLARVVVGVHWPTDILAGILVAFVSVFVASRLLSLSR